MLAVKTMLVLGSVLLWAGVTVAAEAESIPDSSINAAPRKSGGSLSLGLSSEPFLSVRRPFEPRYRTLRIGLGTKSLALKPGLLAFCEKLATDLDEFQMIIGVPTLQEALSISMEFLSFSKDFTTYGNHRLYTGFKFPMIESKNLKTGIFYSF